MGRRFDASSCTEVLEGLFRERAPRRLTALLEGPAAAIAETVVLTTFEGRLVDVTAGRRTGPEALTVLGLAEGGELEEIPVERPERDPVRYPDGIGLYRQAAANAAEIRQLLAPLGGLGAVPAADLDRLVSQLEQIPDAANEVLRLADNRSTNAEILARSPHDLKLTARILYRLAESEIVVPPATLLPEPLDELPEEKSEPVVPAPGEVEGEAVAADVQQWLENEEPPPPLLSQDAFTSAFTRETPGRSMTPRPGTTAPLPERAPDVSARVRHAVPLTTKRPGPAEEEEEFFRQAGVGRTSPGTWIVLVLAGAALGVAGSLFVGGGDAPEIGEQAAIEVVAEPDESEESETATVAETASVAVELGPDGRPPIAGPDAPEDVKRAEQLLNAGRYPEARSLLEQLQATRPSDPTVFILSGQVEVDVGRLTQANQLAERAIELDPKSYRGWVLLGSVLQFRGRFKPAERAYRQALELEPNHPMTGEIQSVLEQLQKTLNR